MLGSSATLTGTVRFLAGTSRETLSNLLCLLGSLQGNVWVNASFSIYG